MTTQIDRTSFLRRSLLIDAAASGLTGMLLLAAAGPLSSLFGLSAPGIARAVGAGLVVFAGALFWNARRASIRRGEAVAAVVLNAGWVLGSIVLIADGPLSLIGNVAVAAVAAAVLVFAVLEIVGLRRLRDAVA